MAQVGQKKEGKIALVTGSNKGIGVCVHRDQQTLDLVTLSCCAYSLIKLNSSHAWKDYTTFYLMVPQFI